MDIERAAKALGLQVMRTRDSVGDRAWHQTFLVSDGVRLRLVS